MRIIDADKLIEILEMNNRNLQGQIKDERVEVQKVVYEAQLYSTMEMIRVIEEQPTAFDVDKVVEQLEEKRFKTNWFMANNINDTTRFSIESNRAFAYDTAIEIVKAGGIDE